MELGLSLAWFCCVGVPVHACTIFVLTDTNRTLFCNNEDWTSFKTRIWFVSSSDKHHGGVYVGFDNDYAQGGMNTEGLAFDWVSGYTETWQPDPKVPVAWGNSGQEALESCATVEEAIAYFRGHQDRGFYRAKILLADRTGASAIIGGKDGKLQVEQANTCRGFGYGEKTLGKILTPTTEPTVSNAFKILRACLQKDATKYANVFDLKSGDIFLYPFPDRDDQVKFNLTAELKKCGHYYDMPQIKEQLPQAPRPLLADMQRLMLDKYKPIPDQEPEVTARVRSVFQSALDGTMRADAFTAERWKHEAPRQKQTQETLRTFGRLVSLTLVDHSTEGGKRSYRYRMEFEHCTVLQYMVLDAQNKIAESHGEDIR